MTTQEQPPTTSPVEQIEEVLGFWFGQLDDAGLAAPEHAAKWWAKDDAFDATIRARFGSLHERVAAGAQDVWLSSARGRLAYIIVLDQFSRNMFRDTPAMYEFDPRALAVALEGITNRVDETLPADPRIFFYLPLMHSEDLVHQERCVELFTRMLAEASDPVRERVRGNLEYAIMHRDIVARFGRFPHRNRILGRTSTREEQEFLTQPNSSF